jgi:type II secretory pathway component PulJ
MVLFELVIALFIFGLVAFSLVMALDAAMDANHARNQADAAVRGLENQLALLQAGPLVPTDRDLPDDGSGFRYHLQIEAAQMQDQKHQPVPGMYQATLTAHWLDRGDEQEESVQKLFYQP